jgi:ATP-dependent Clp protease adaptor protein ClpS
MENMADVEVTIEPEVDEELEVKEPNMWLVIFHDDDKTSMEFVIMLLMQLFHKTMSEATELMLQVHNEGSATVGRYTHEVAEEKMNTGVRTARAYGFPLNISIEEDD